METVWSPGRVNLIGDHTDYSLLPVLPMAIDRGIGLAVAPGNEAVIKVFSTDQAEPLRIPTVGPKPAAPNWGRYLRGVLAVLGDKGTGRGARIAIEADLPATGGLASSSSLTMGLLISLDRVWSLEIQARDLVDLAIASERLVGVESGGMDQIVIATAQKGTALRIDFDPQRRRTVPIPDHLSFVIGYSGTSAEKAGGAELRYNRSVVACRAAAALLAGNVGRDPGDPPTLGRIIGSISDADIRSLPVMATAAEAASVAGLPNGSLTNLTRGALDADEPLGIRAAAAHVISEAARVEDAEAALLAGDGVAVGRLFDLSHESLGRFGSTTQGLDAVTSAARGAGAFGARVTGAGFGGWAVSVCDAGKASAVAAAMTATTGGPAIRVLPSAGIA